jgi:hypothetical protein
MNPADPFAVWRAWFDLMASMCAPRQPPATVTDIREGHAIRARRAQRERART